MKKIKGLGWKKQGIERFSKLLQEVEDMRDRDTERIQELAEHINTCYRELSAKNDESDEELLSQGELNK